MARTNSHNQLESPGAGLPRMEAFALNAAFKTGTAFMSAKRATKLFERESAELIRLVNDDESYDITEQRTIPRVIGIEDSSRDWSVLMILAHLHQANTDMLKIVEALSDGVVPRGEIDVALYKPSREVDFDMIARFQGFNLRYVEGIQKLIDEKGTLRTHVRYAHPWFGPIDAHQWHCLAAIHQRIHRRHAHKLITMLGLT